MSFKRTTISYSFTPEAKASMIIILDKFGEDLITLHQIKEMIRVSGAVVLDAHYAVVLAAIVHPYLPAYSEKLLAPLETFPAMSPNEYQGKFFELVNQVT